MSTSQFDKIMSGKSDAELRSIIADKDGYRIEAREVAIRELEGRSGDVSADLEQLTEMKSQLASETELDAERKRRKENFFYIPEKAPRIVKIIGIVYYVILGIGIIQFFVVIVPIFRIVGFSLMATVIPAIIFFLQAILIDAILKGKNWARIVNLVFSGFGILTQIGAIVSAHSIAAVEIDTFDLIQSIIYLAAAIILFVEPSKQWFEKKKDRQKQVDLLDDL